MAELTTGLSAPVAHHPSFLTSEKRTVDTLRRRLASLGTAFALCSTFAAAPATAAIASTALSARPDVAPLASVPVVALAPLDLDRVRHEDELREAMDLPLRYALAEAVFISPALHGSWERLDDERWLWRVRLAAPRATSLGFGFTRFDLPAGARLLVAAADLSRELPAFSASDTEAHGELWTPPLATDEALLELVVPIAGRSELELELTTIALGYRGFGDRTLAPESGGCNVDVACPEGDPWRDQVRAVVMLSVGGTEICSGALLNNTALDGKPLVLTSASCGITEANAASVVAFWNYQNSTCRPPGSPASGGTGDGSKALFNTGAIFRARASGTDSVLIELDDPVPTAADAFLAGWDRGLGDPASAATIHHPSTDEKRISLDAGPLATTSYLSNGSPGDGTHLRVGNWELGTTEGGSGGAPLFSSNRLVVGQLHGGYAACGNSEPDWFGRLSFAWNAGATAATRLRDWLDPVASGATTLVGVPVASTRLPPAAPTGLVATALSASAIALSWSDHADNESTFVVQSRTASTAFVEIARLPANTGAVTVTALPSQTTFTFRVRAENPWGQSAWTNEATASTYGATEPCVRDARTACLLAGRFELRVDWRTGSSSGAAQLMGFDGERAESDQSAFFTFFAPTNFEMGVKMVNACVPPFQSYWIFVSGLTDQAFTVTVRDTANGRIKTYSNPLGTLPQTIGDTSALSCTGGDAPELVFVPVADREALQRAGTEAAPPRAATAAPDIRIAPNSLALGPVTPRTIRVEIDWMETTGHSHRPSPEVLAEIVSTFAAAGYTVVLELSDAIPHQDVVDVTTTIAASPQIQAIATQYFDHAADPGWYYSLWVHTHSRNGTPTTAAGIADFPPGRSHLVSLGAFAGQIGSFSNRVGTFIHELGHNMAQTHSGVGNIESRNYKPNYLSIMNYRYMLGGIGPTLVAQGLAATAAGFDDYSYSHGLMPDLDEHVLDERFGIGLGKAVDWDCDGRIEASVERNLRVPNWCVDEPGATTLVDFDNWSNIPYYLLPGGEGPSDPGGATSCMTYEEFRPLEERLTALRAAGALPPDGPRSVGLTLAPENAAGSFFTIWNDGDAALEVSSIALDIASPWLRWEPTAPFTVAPGKSQRVMVFLDLAAAPSNLVRRRFVVRSNDPDENPYPNGVDLELRGNGPPILCPRDARTACLLGGRFEVRLDWQTATETGSGRIMSFNGKRAESDLSAFYWFFQPENFEAGIKMVDACLPPYNRFWVFVSGLTNQGFTVTVHDTQTGRVKAYSNPLGTLPVTRGDTDAFPCP